MFDIFSLARDWLDNSLNWITDVLSAPFDYWRKPTPPKFFAIIPADPNLTCVATNDKRCRRRPNARSRYLASRIRENLSMREPSGLGTTLLLEAFAKNCLCHRHNKSSGSDTFLKPLVKAWHGDLKDAFKELTFPVKNDSLTQKVHNGHQNVNFSIQPAPQTNSADSDLICMPDSLGVPSTPPYQSSNAPSQLVDDTWTSTSQCLLNQWKARFSSTPPHIELESFTKFHLGSLDVLGKTSHEEPREFLPYRRAKASTLWDVITSPLSMEDTRSAHIYAFTRAGDESFIKIGYTRQAVNQRLAQWERGCKCKPRLLWVSKRKIPYAKRIEVIVHRELELRSLRWQEACKTNPECETVHIEWFKVSQAEATKTIEYWIEWMQTHLPYNESGLLKSEAVNQMVLPIPCHADPCKAIHFLSDSCGKFWSQARSVIDNTAGD